MRYIILILTGLFSAIFALPVSAQVFHYGKDSVQNQPNTQYQGERSVPFPADPVEPSLDSTANPSQETTTSVADVSRDRVVLLHGMGHGPFTMKDMEATFEKLGYKVSNLNLKLEHDTLHEVIDETYDDLRRFMERDEDRMHFVCYSQGCLVVRGLIEQHRPRYLGRVVMLGPPNQGGVMVDYLRKHEIAAFFNKGRHLPNLGTSNKRMLARLIGTSAEGYDLGIIAGREDRETNLPINLAAAPENRRFLGPERTKLDGMKEFVAVQADHDSLYSDREVQAMAVKFIRTGSFISPDQNHLPQTQTP